MGHQADPAHCYKFSFPTQIAVHLTKYKYIVFVTGEDDIARFNPWRYNYLVDISSKEYLSVDSAFELP